MEPWLQKAVDAKLLIEKNIRVRSSDGSKAVAKAVGYTCAKGSSCQIRVGAPDGPPRVVARAARWHGAVQDAPVARHVEVASPRRLGLRDRRHDHTEVADEHSVYIESLGGRYVWDEDRSCWKWTVYVD